MISISTDKSKLQVENIHQFLTTTYWAKGRTLNQVKSTINNSLCYGVYLKGEQIGFARVVTDFTIFAYLMDVYILPDHQLQGYSKQLLKTITQDAKLKSCTTWLLKTSDAHDLYKKFDFTELEFPEKVMERIIHT